MLTCKTWRTFKVNAHNDHMCGTSGCCTIWHHWAHHKHTSWMVSRWQSARSQPVSLGCRRDGKHTEAETKCRLTNEHHSVQISRADWHEGHNSAPPEATTHTHLCFSPHVLFCHAAAKHECYKTEEDRSEEREGSKVAGKGLLLLHWS